MPPPPRPDRARRRRARPRRPRPSSSRPSPGHPYPAAPRPHDRGGTSARATAPPSGAPRLLRPQRPPVRCRRGPHVTWRQVRRPCAASSTLPWRGAGQVLPARSRPTPPVHPRWHRGRHAGTAGCPSPWVPWRCAAPRRGSSPRPGRAPGASSGPAAPWRCPPRLLVTWRVAGSRGRRLAPRPSAPHRPAPCCWRPPRRPARPRDRVPRCVVGPRRRRRRRRCPRGRVVVRPRRGAPRGHPARPGGTVRPACSPRRDRRASPLCPAPRTPGAGRPVVSSRPVGAARRSDGQPTAPRPSPAARGRWGSPAPR